MPIKYSLYPTNWFSELRPAVLARAEHRCENCGLPNYSVFRVMVEGQYAVHSKHDTFQAAQKIQLALLASDYHHDWKIIKLAIAHLDHDVTNNDLSNLKALCQRCHLAHDRTDNARRRKYGKYHKTNQIKLNFDGDNKRPTEDAH